jgi:hypothetical protein
LLDDDVATGLVKVLVDGPTWNPAQPYRELDQDGALSDLLEYGLQVL